MKKKDESQDWLTRIGKDWQRWEHPPVRFGIEGDKATPKVVHCKKEKFDVYIGRPSIWGNPFVIGEDGTRDEVVDKYREWLLNNPELITKLPELAGKTLACWCAPNRCHGDVLLELANAPKVETS